MTRRPTAATCWRMVRLTRSIKAVWMFQPCAARTCSLAASVPHTTRYLTRTRRRRRMVLTVVFQKWIWQLLMPLIYHMLFPSISTFETLPRREAAHQCASRDGSHQEQHLDNLRRKDAVREAETIAISVYLGNY